ncbi:MAG: hypothetical protein IKB66_04590 [Clostridia bacterium]|nr:hypothetical protein [Clostridia bacterium]
MDKDEIKVGQNFNIDSLLDEAIADNQSNEQFESNRVKSDSEIAREELFSAPLKIDMEQIDINLGLKPKKAPKKVEDTQQIKEQQKIDLDAAAYNIYKMEEKASENNYKKVLSKLVRNNDIKTESFKIKDAEESIAFEGESEYVDENAIKKADVVENSIADSSVSVRVYSPKTAVDDLYGLTFINKVKFLTLACVSLLALIETGAIYLYLNANFVANSLFFLIATLIAIIPLGFGVFLYALDPSKKVRSKFAYGSYFLNSLIVFVLVAVLILVFGLLASIPFGDLQESLPKIVLPALFILDYPLGVGIFTIIAKSEVFAVKK